MRDHLVLARQTLRDFGLSGVSLRQLAKLLVLRLRPPTDPVVGIRRRPERDYSMTVPFGFVTPDSRPAGSGSSPHATCSMPIWPESFATSWPEYPGDWMS